MGNPDHIRWILEGVEFWNKKRSKEKFTPDLEHEDLTGIFGALHSPNTLRPPLPVMRGFNLSSARLNGAILENLDFAGSNFTAAHLNNARMHGSSFTGATFFGSHLNDAKLHECDFAGVRFDKTWLQSSELAGADLRGAEFVHCHLEGADFSCAKLGGADFPLSMPWKARLFRRIDCENARDDESFKSGNINSVEDLLSRCRDFRSRHGDDVILYFRGESRWASDWKLSPSVLREPGKKKQRNLRPVEGEMLIDLMTRQPEAFSGLDSALAEWVLAQHYRLPTRFLDITRNPLVAMFNACRKDKRKDGQIHIFAVPKGLVKPFNSDTVSIIANFAKLARWEKNLLLGKIVADSKNDEFHPLAHVEASELMSRAKIRLYDGVRQEKAYFEKRLDIRDLFRVFVVEPQRTFERLRAQSGAFLISAFHERFECKEVSKCFEGMPMYSHFPRKVSQECKETIVEDLELLNVTRETLYPSVDESAKEVAKRYRHSDGSLYANLTPSY